MGDRCWLQVTFHPDDVGNLCDGSDLRSPDEEDPVGVERDALGPGSKGVVCTFYDANYGYNDALHDAAHSGVRFRALQGHGDEYTAGIVIGWDDKVYEINTDNDFGYTVPVNSSGEIQAGSLERVREFIAVEKKFLDCLANIASVQRNVVPLKDWKPCDEKKPDG